jgi:hypothetical protein
MKEYLAVIGVIVIFMGGFGYGSLNNYVDNISDCGSFTKKGVAWKGYRAISDDNERRCFFVEQQYPYRTWHGVNKT